MTSFSREVSIHTAAGLTVVNTALLAGVHIRIK